MSSSLSRSTWLEVLGVPLHCWNQIPLTRLADLWDSFEAVGENANHVLNCEKVSILITTSFVSRISEVVEIEVSNLSFSVRVEEKGLMDRTCQSAFVNSKYKQGSEKGKNEEDSVSNTSWDCSREVENPRQQVKEL
ncbi:hypothetical protein V6N13_060264 [Hibiscus sabdariffa]